MSVAEPTSSTRRSMLTLALGVAVIGLQDPIIKGLMDGYPLAEAIVIRSIAALPIFAILLWRLGFVTSLRSGSQRVFVARGVVLMLAYTTYFLSFPAMPLANVIALYFTAPLFVVALSRPVLHEQQGAGRWAAVLVGLVGAIVVAHPTGAGIGWSALLPVVAAALYAFGQIIARRWGGPSNATVMSFHQNSVFLVGASAFALIAAPLATTAAGTGPADFLLRAWVMPDLRDLLLLALCGPIAVAGTILLTKAYREAPPGAVTVLEYTLLIWATFWGFVVFGEVPGPWTIVGASLIIMSGAYAMTRAAPVASV